MVTVICQCIMKCVTKMNLCITNLLYNENESLLGLLPHLVETFGWIYTQLGGYVQGDLT